MNDLKRGCILFDDPEEHRAAWACVHGEAPYRIRGIEDIGNDAVWLTNLPFEVMYSAGLVNHAFLRRSSFLRLRHDVILQETGLQNHSPDTQARFLASVFGRVMRLMREHFAYPKVPLGELRHAVRELLFPPDPSLPDDLIYALRDATQEYAQVERSRPRENRIIMGLWFPRLDHAQRVLSIPVPGSPEFERVVIKNFPHQTPEDVHAWILGRGAPVMLLRIKIHGVRDESVYPLINFGAGVMPKRDRGKGRLIKTWVPTRQWITTPEAMFMAPFVDFEVTHAIVFKRVQRFMDLPIIQRFYERITPAHRVSYSTGIMAENLWIGAATALEKIPNVKDSGNLAAPFLRAQDRALCFRAARVLHDMGLDVIGYGAGRIHVAVDPQNDEEYDRVIQACCETGLIPEAWTGENKPFTLTTSDPDVRALQTLALHRAWEALDQIDRFAVEEHAAG